MTNLEQTYINRIENTSNYGIIKDNMANYDEERILSEYILNFRLYKIRCWTINNLGITGIQIIHKDRITSKEVTTIDISPKEYENEAEIMLEPNEMINSITLWKEESLRGFEVKTNKNNGKKFGWCGEGTKIELDDDFDNGNNSLVGFYLGFNKKECIINSMGFYYINKKSFYLLINLGIFMLRVKCKNNEFKKKLEEKIEKLDYSDKALLKACCLPDNPFFSVFKYIFV
jgi:hypothetical protein